MQRLRIAVAEDNWFVAEHLCSELEMLGHEVVGRARTGDELVALVEGTSPDLALVDIRLAGGSDGLAAAIEIEKRFAVPAIAATGHLSAEEVRQAGLLGLLRKPFTLVALKAVLSGAADWLADRTRHRPFLYR